MELKKCAVTYVVTFTEKSVCAGITYYPGVAYHFTAIAESSHRGDCADAAYDDMLYRFDCVDRNTAGGDILVGKLSRLGIKGDPVIVKVEEVAL